MFFCASHIYSACKSIAVLWCVLIVTCTEYNPFTDPSNANTIISYQSVKDNDTLGIFSRETLNLVFTVPGLIDSVKIGIPGNRISPNRRVFDRTSDLLSGGNHIVEFSYNDTGSKVIDISTFRSNGEVLKQRIALYVKNPLNQKHVTGRFGDTIDLRTKPVEDTLAEYIWEFRGTTIKSFSSDTSVVLTDAIPAGIGYLRVTDGLTFSPAVPFDFSIEDVLSPLIGLLDTTIKSDTVLCSDRRYPLAIIIKDPGSGTIDSASINGSPFDVVNDSVYIKYFLDIDPLKGAIPVTIYARDKAIPHNVSEKQLILKYDPTGKKVSNLRLSILIPQGDRTVTSLSARTLFGKVTKLINDNLPVNIQIRVNETNMKPFQITGSDWSMPVSLGNGNNSVQVTAFYKDDTVSNVKEIVYDPFAPDSTPPVILDISVESFYDKEYIDTSHIKLRVLTFDEQSGVDSVILIQSKGDSSRILKKQYLIKNDSNEYIWVIQDIELLHLKEGNWLTIIAKDKKGRSASMSKVLYFNHPPEFTLKVPPPNPLRIGDVYISQITCTDVDNDKIEKIDLITSDTTVRIENSNITWVPKKVTNRVSLKDSVSFTIKISDGIETTSKTFWTYVVDSTVKIDTLQLRIDLSAIPPFLVGGVDTMRIKFDCESGNPPYRFNVWVKELRDTLEIDSNMVQWCPGATDTGEFHFGISVQDLYGKTDSSFISIKVLKPNRSFTLECTHLPDTLPDGSLNMRYVETVDTLRYRINDPDMPVPEMFNVEALLGTNTQNVPVDKNLEFFIVLRAASVRSGKETLKIFVKDKAGIQDSTSVVVDYGLIVQPPVLSEPSNNILIGTTDVEFSWEGNNPDNENVRYYLYAGLCGEDLPLLSSQITTSAGATLTTTGTYCWRVVADNGKMRAVSTLQTFTLMSPLHVRFLTDQVSIRSFYEVGKDTIKVPLLINNSTLKVQYSAKLTSKTGFLPVIGTNVEYIPVFSDLGWQTLTISVFDSINKNSDSITASVFIYASSQTGQIKVAFPDALNDTIDLRLSEPDSIQEIRFIILDSDEPFTESYTVRITQQNITRSFNLDTARSFAISVMPGKANCLSEDIQLIISEGNESQDTLNLTLIYKDPIMEKRVAAREPSLTIVGVHGPLNTVLHEINREEMY